MKLWDKILNSVVGNLEGATGRKYSLLTRTAKYDRSGWRQDKPTQEAIRQDVAKGRKISVSSPQSSRWSVDQQGLMDLRSKAEQKEQPDVEAPLKETSVASTAVKSIDYNPKTRNLDIQYTTGPKKYRFPNVPPEAVTEFLEAPSKGKWLYYEIQPKYSTNPASRRRRS